MFEFGLYIVLLLLGVGTFLWAGNELIKTITGRADYYVADVILRGSPAISDAPTITNLVKLRIAEIRTDLKNNKVSSRTRYVLLSSRPKVTIAQIPTWASVAEPARNDQLADLKLNIGGLDLGSFLSWLQSKIVSHRTLNLTVTFTEHTATVTGDVGIFDSRNPSIMIQMSKDKGPDAAFAYQIADRIACALVRHQLVGKPPRNFVERFLKQNQDRVNEQRGLRELGDDAFRITLYSDTTKVRADRSAYLTQVKQEIKAQMDYAWKYMENIFEKVAGPDAKKPEEPELQLFPDDLRSAYVDFIYHKRDGKNDAADKNEFDIESPTTAYNAPPMARFIPDRTFGIMAFLFVVELKKGALRRTGQVAWDGESGAILNSYIDTFGAVVKRQYLSEDKRGGNWALVQQGGIDWQNGIDLATTNTKDQKPLRSLEKPGSCDDDHQVGSWDLHIVGNDLINGIHQNSGILNRAFYNACEKVPVDRTAEIWLRGLQAALSGDPEQLKANPLHFEGLVKAISSEAGEDKSTIDAALRAVGFLDPAISEITTSLRAGARPGSDVTLKGSAFGTTKSDNVITFDGVNSDFPVKSWSNSEIIFTLKDSSLNLTLGQKSIGLIVRKQKSNNINLLVLRQPTISDFACSNDLTSFTVTGKGFGDRSKGDTIKINDTSAENVRQWTDETIVFENPDPAKFKPGATVTLGLFLDGDKDTPTVRTDEKNL